MKLYNFSTNLFFQHFKFVQPVPKHTIYPLHTNISPQYIVYQMYYHSPAGHVRETHSKTNPFYLSNILLNHSARLWSAAIHYKTMTYKHKTRHLNLPKCKVCNSGLCNGFYTNHYTNYYTNLIPDHTIQHQSATPTKKPGTPDFMRVSRIYQGFRDKGCNRAYIPICFADFLTECRIYAGLRGTLSFGYQFFGW